MVPLLFAPFPFAGHTLFACAQGALWWPAMRALLVADLHLEKASFFARFGQPLPPYDSVETLSRLAALVEETGAQAIWCLGDSFHDAEGPERLPGEARALLERLAAGREWLWITGNHDAGGDFPLGEAVVEQEVAGLVLRHEAEPGEQRCEVSGHFHPKLSVRHRGRGVSRRCFLLSGRHLVLPAFGALTGGLDLSHPAFRPLLAPGAQALVVADGRLLRFPALPVAA